MPGQRSFVGQMADSFHIGIEESEPGTIGGAIGDTGVGAGPGDLRPRQV